MPYFVALDSLGPDVAHIRIVVIGAGYSDLGNELQDGIEGHSAHAGNGSEGIAFYESSDEAGAFRHAQAIHAPSMHEQLKHVNEIIAVD